MSARRRAAQAWLSLALGCGACGGGMRPPGSPAPLRSASADALESRLDALFTRLGEWGFAGAALVATRDGVVLERAVGPIGPGSDRPITPDAAFDIASLSKQFTAAAVLRLADAGRLDLVDSIGALLSDVPADRAGITVHQLLTHTAGLPREVGRDFESMSRNEFVRRALVAPRGSSPGTEHSYSNAGYALLAAIVEQVSGMPYHQFLRNEIFRPAGLNRTGFYSSVPAGVPIARAVGGALAGQSPEGWEHTWNHRGSGGMVSTVQDLYLWTLALDAGRVLSARSLERQRTSHTRNGYGYGVQVEQAQGRPRLRHAGLWYAFTSDYRYFPDDSVTIVVLSNEALDGFHAASVTAAALEAAVFGLEREVPPAVTTGDRVLMERLAGRYVVSDGAEIAIAAEADHLVVVGTGQPALSALTDPTPAPDPAGVAAVNQATLEILGGVDRGDFATLLATAPSERAERYRRILPGIWRQRQDSLGSIVGIDLIGTIAPAGSDRTWETHARIRYVRGEERIALYWTPSGQLVGLANGDPSIPAALTTFRPIVDGFAAHNLGTGTTVRLQPTPDGVAIARADGQRLHAVRVP